MKDWGICLSVPMLYLWTRISAMFSTSDVEVMPPSFAEGEAGLSY